MKKLIFLPAILLAFYLAIMCVVMFGIIKIHNHDHFGITLTFEIIGLLLLAAVAVVNMIANPPVKTGFFAPLTLTTLFYTMILHIINVILVQFIPTIWGTLLNLILLFVYLTIAIFMVMAGRMDQRPHSGVQTMHVIGREARQEGTRACPHCNMMIPYSVEFCPVCGKQSSPPKPPEPPVRERYSQPAYATFGGATQVPYDAPGAPGTAYVPPQQQRPYPQQGMASGNQGQQGMQRGPMQQGGTGGMVCSCGAPLAMGTQFCTVCGKRIG